MKLSGAEKLLFALCVAASIELFAAFSDGFTSTYLWHPVRRKTHFVQDHQRQRSCLPLLSASLDINNPKTPKPVNIDVRAIIKLVQDTYAEENVTVSWKDKNWSRFRKYLYRSYKRLSLPQAQEVLAFLNETFPGEHALHITILQESPRILARQVDTLLRPTVEFLINFYGPELFDVAIRRNHDLLLTRGLGYKRKPSSDKLETFFLEHLKLSPTNIARLKRKDPALFQHSFEKVSAVTFFIEKLLIQGNYSKSMIRATTAKLLTRYPAIFKVSVKSKLKPQIDFLKRYCYFSSSDVARLLVTKTGAAPQLTVSVEQNLKPTMEYLSYVMGGPDEGMLRQCLLGHPQILNLALTNIKRKVEFFDSIQPPPLDADGNRIPAQGLAARVMSKSPPVYATSLTQSIIPKVIFLARVWGINVERLDNESIRVQAGSELADLLSEMPSVLTLSLEDNLQPTLRFYNSTGYIKLDEGFNLKEQSDYCYRIRGRELCASLFQRLMPRHHFVLSRCKNAHSQSITGPLMSLNTLVALTDEAFCKLWGVTIEEYEHFKEKEVPQLRVHAQIEAWLGYSWSMDLSQL